MMMLSSCHDIMLVSNSLSCIQINIPIKRGYFPVYSYYYIPYAFLYGPGLGSSYYYPGPTIINTPPSVCNNCLTKITPQDEQDILNSKSPVSQSDLPSEQSSAASSSTQSESNNANPSEPTKPSEQSSPPPSS